MPVNNQSLNKGASDIIGCTFVVYSFFTGNSLLNTAERAIYPNSKNHATLRLFSSRILSLIMAMNSELVGLPRRLCIV